MSVELLRPARVTVQDAGRPGYAHLGVPRSGAVDPAALCLANRLVGNEEWAAALEVVLAGAELRLSVPRWVAVTGAPAEVRVDGRPGRLYEPVFVPAGGTLHIGPSRQGVYTYVAVGGGVACAPVLGSRATDLLAGVGPAPLAPGEPVPLGEPGTVPAAVDVAPPPAMPDAPRLRLYPGPRRDWFTPEAERLLATAEYTVSERSNRIGIRLAGPVLPRRRTGELASEGLVLGAVEVTPSGELVVLLADHPTTGGYPVVAVVDPVHVPVAAQCRPGTRVRFVVDWD
jgi:biotin-dependent carboxylase-like uncharacterized protein